MTEVLSRAKKMELLKKPKHKGHLFLPLVREHEILRPYVLRGRPLQLPSAASTEQRSVAQCVWAPLVPPGERSGAEGEGEGEGREIGLESRQGPFTCKSPKSAVSASALYTVD